VLELELCDSKVDRSTPTCFLLLRKPNKSMPGTEGVLTASPGHTPDEKRPPPAKVGVPIVTMCRGRQYFLWCVSKCEQPTRCSGVTLPLTWRVGALRSISERVDIFPSVRPLSGSPTRGVLRVLLADLGRPPPTVTPRKSCDQRNVHSCPNYESQNQHKKAEPLISWDQVSPKTNHNLRRLSLESSMQHILPDSSAFFPSGI
jgi:hypothetical protein